MTSNLVKDAINYGDIIYVRYYYEDNGELLMLSINGTTTHRYQVGTGDN